MSKCEPKIINVPQAQRIPILCWPSAEQPVQLQRRGGKGAAKSGLADGECGSTIISAPIELFTGVLTEPQMRVLRNVLGDRVNDLMPLLENLAGWYRDPELRSIRTPVNHGARAQALAAKKLKGRLLLVQKEIKRLHRLGWRDLMPSAQVTERLDRVWQRLALPPTLVTRIGQTTHIVDNSRMTPADAWLVRTAENIGALIQDVEQWERRARGRAARRRGRGEPTRLHFAVAVALCLLLGGLNVTKARDGRYSKILGALLEAANYAVPEDLFPLLKQAVDRAQRELPWYVTMRTESPELIIEY